ncbi:leucine-rich repeat protein, partial [Sodaliphilus sp.]|uniref:leucine-rich repeat protein n=1 Tax=Sodaliphilus sp. TaxID=2815818 RepID=UPI00388DCB75
MKKLLSLIVMIAVAMTVMAQNFEYDGLKYSVTKSPDGNIWGEVEVEGCVSTTASYITIPPSVTNDGKTYNVTKIYSLAFYNHPSLTSVRISYGVKWIDDQAFLNCNKLTTVYLPSSVTKIDYRAFASCDALTSVYVARQDLSQITFGTDVWPEKSSKMTMYVPHGGANVTNELLKYFSIAIDSNLLAYDLYMNDGTVSIVTEPTPTSTPKGNNKCTIVGFNPKGSLVTGGAYVPQRAVSTPTGYESKFEYTQIASNAFVGSTMTKADLTNLTSVKTIYQNAFKDCAALTMVTLPKNLTSLGEQPFTGCKALTEISIDQNNNFYTVNGILYQNINSVNTLLCVPANSPLTSITFPKIDCIAQGAIVDQAKARYYTLPYGLKTIEQDAIYNSPIQQINIPSSATGLRINFIHYCTLPAKSRFIFNFTGQGDVTNVYYWFNTVDSSAELLVPRESAAEYKAGKYWKQYFSKVNPDNSCAYDIYKNQVYYTVTSDEPTTIGGTSYDGTVTAVYGIPQVSTGGMHLNIDAFTATNGKTYAPTRIDAYAFKGNNVLDIALGTTVSSFATGAFSDVPSLTDVTLLNTGSVRWDGAFFGNNASSFMFWVDHKMFNSFFTSAMGNWNINGGKKGIDYLGSYIKTSNDNTMFSCSAPVNFNGTKLNTYSIWGITGNKIITSYLNISDLAANQGVLVTSIKPDQIYRIPRAKTAGVTLDNMLVAVPASQVNIYQQQVGFRWDPAQHKFIRPTKTVYASSGSAYLKLTPEQAGNYNEIYFDLWPAPEGKKGDVNGDGEVDITDANILTNIILGKDTASNYGGRADVDGNGAV